MSISSTHLMERGKLHQDHGSHAEECMCNPGPLQLGLGKFLSEKLENCHQPVYYKEQLLIQWYTNGTRGGVWWYLLDHWTSAAWQLEQERNINSGTKLCSVGKVT